MHIIILMTVLMCSCYLVESGQGGDKNGKNIINLRKLKLDITELNDFKKSYGTSFDPEFPPKVREYCISSGR